MWLIFCTFNKSLDKSLPNFLSNKLKWTKVPECYKYGRLLTQILKSSFLIIFSEAVHRLWTIATKLDSTTGGVTVCDLKLLFQKNLYPGNQIEKSWSDVLFLDINFVRTEIYQFKQIINRVYFFLVIIIRNKLPRMTRDTTAR